LARPSYPGLAVLGISSYDYYDYASFCIAPMPFTSRSRPRAAPLTPRSRGTLHAGARRERLIDRFDMKIPFETILDFHAHGCPIGHEGLLFPLGANGSIEILIEWKKWGRECAYVAWFNGPSPKSCPWHSCLGIRKRALQKILRLNSPAGKNIGLQPRPEAVLGEGEHLRLLVVLYGNLLPDGDDLLG
jgi:hypothetical protein